MCCCQTICFKNLLFCLQGLTSMWGWWNAEPFMPLPQKFCMRQPTQSRACLCTCSCPWHFSAPLHSSVSNSSCRKHCLLLLIRFHSSVAGSAIWEQGASKMMFTDVEERQEQTDSRKGKLAQWQCLLIWGPKMICGKICHSLYKSY